MRRVLLAAMLVLLVTSSFAVGQTACTLINITEYVPDMPLGQPVHYEFEACCGTPPYTFAVTSGTLEAGLILTPTGKLRGVPIETGDNTVYITVVDATGCSNTTAYPFRVVAP
jgi:Putative Ig domain